MTTTRRAILAPMTSSDAHQDPCWLTETEKQAWRALLEIGSGLFDVVTDDLKAQAGLTLEDYDVLHVLSETPGRAQRVGKLSDQLLTRRTRLTQRIDQLEKRGLVAKERSLDDGRAVNVVLTDAGWDLLAGIAPGHVESVRTHLFDHLTNQDVKHLVASLEKVAAYLHAARGNS